MKIIIVGCGNVGATIARNLSDEGHDITIVDVNDSSIKDLSKELDVMGVIGSGTELSVLKEAGVEASDLVISVTDSDERNLLCCLLSKKSGAKKTIARVRNPEYSNEIEFIKDDLGLSLSVNPELSAADEMLRLLKFPSAIEIDTFAGGRVELFKFEVTKESPLCGVALKHMSKRLEAPVLVCVVERGNETFIPDGNFTMWEGDKVSVVASGKRAAAFFRVAGLNKGQVKDVMITGGGDISFYLAKALIASSVNVKIIEENKKRCEELSELLPKAIIINGECSDKNLLLEEGIEKIGGFVALSDSDEENVMLSIFAKSVNPEVKLITKVHKNAYDDIISNMNLGSIINPKLLTGEAIVKFVRAMSLKTSSSMESLYRLCNERVEALEFRAEKGSPLIEVPLMKLNIKENVLVASIVHKGAIETPKGSSVIYEGDSVIIVTTNKGFKELSDILN